MAVSLKSGGCAPSGRVCWGVLSWMAVLLFGVSGCSRSVDDSGGAPNVAPTATSQTRVVEASPASTPLVSDAARTAGVVPPPTSAFPAPDAVPAALAVPATPATAVTAPAAAPTPDPANPRVRQSLHDSLAKRFEPYELQAIANEELENEQEAVVSVDKELPPPPEPWPAEYTEKRAALEFVREQAVRQHVAELYQVTDAELVEIVLESMDRPM